MNIYGNVGIQDYKCLWNKVTGSKKRNTKITICISPALVRFSIGLEDEKDIIADIDNALTNPKKMKKVEIQDIDFPAAM